MAELIINAFVMDTGSHTMHGLWRHPEAQQHKFDDIQTWIGLAKTLEAGLFDALFFADVVGLHGPLQDDNYALNVREGLQIPNSDPSIVLAALAVNTENLGLALTSSVLQSHPFEFARRASTLDQISGGRFAWNIVTSTLENSARNFNYERLTDHDERYEWADEYADVVYKLWEGSWDEGALLKDKGRGIFSDAQGVHRINHAGKRYRVEGPHLSAPTPQRTPFLFQAGSSTAGRQFAARHAEGVFISVPNPKAAAELIANTRSMVSAAGRNQEDVKFLQIFTIIIGSTMEEALRKQEEYESYVSLPAFLKASGIGISQDTGVAYAPETLLADIRTNGARSHIDGLRKMNPDREPTVGDLGALIVRRHPRLVGTPESIADELAVWQQAGLDGINVGNWILPGSYEDFIQYLLPELQKRGMAKRAYRRGTLREKLLGKGRLLEGHPAAHYRGFFVPKSGRVAVGATIEQPAALEKA